MVHTNMPWYCVVFLLPRRLTRSAIYGSQIVDSHKCADRVSSQSKRNQYAFYNKRLLTLFIDQLVRSKATCPFKLFCLIAACKNELLFVLFSWWPSESDMKSLASYFWLIFYGTTPSPYPAISVHINHESNNPHWWCINVMCVIQCVN